MTELEDVIGQLDRGQRERLRDLASTWETGIGDRAIGAVFAVLMDAVDQADGLEQYVINFAERELLGANEGSE